MEKFMKTEMFNVVLNEVASGVNETLRTMFGIESKALSNKVEAECFTEGDVSGLMSIVGDKFGGAIILSFPKQTIFKILEKVYFMEFTEVNESVISGVGELANIVYGLVKTSINKQGDNLQMSLPNVILGNQHIIVGVSNGPVVKIPFNTELGDFAVLVYLSENSKKSNLAA